MSHEDEVGVIFEEINNIGVITLNRPKALNALNYNMLIDLHPRLLEWEKSKNLVIIKGAGKSFCSGGDLKEVTGSGVEHFATVEYNINFMIGNYKIPYIALLDGAAMGGGLGVSVHGRYRIATENTVVAMPETKIGLIPDVGGTYFLPRLPHNIGFYLALTSNKLRAEDAVTAGIATHFVLSRDLSELQTQLSKCITDADIKQVLSRFHTTPKISTLTPYLNNIAYCFDGDSIEEIITRLEQLNNDWSKEIIKLINKMCPLTIKITLKALRRGATLDLWSCLVMENRLVSRLGKNYNFHEGVRALLIHKDNQPQWNPKTLSEVEDNNLSMYFEPLPNNRELVRIDSIRSKI